MTVFFEKAVWITRNLKTRLGRPVLWGGAHQPVSRRISSIRRYGLRRGRRRNPSRAYGQNDPRRRVLGYPGLWIRKNGTIVRNLSRPLETNLDRYPAPDNSMTDHHILWDDHIIPLTHEIARAFSKPFYPAKDFGKNGYLTLTSRGCPRQCAYCHNSMMKDLYPGQKYLRWRSIRHFISELVEVRSTLPMWIFCIFAMISFLRGASMNCGSSRRNTRIRSGFLSCAAPILCR